jgi:transcriptional regulator with XRE-family HTH domain
MAETTLAGRMAKIVKESGKTKTAFAGSVGITRNYLHTLLSGKSPGCSQTLAILIENLYSYPAEWVLTGEVPAEKLSKELAAKIMNMDAEKLRLLAAYIETLEGDAANE